MAVTNFFSDDWDNFTHDDVEESLKEILQGHETAFDTVRSAMTEVQSAVSGMQSTVSNLQSALNTVQSVVRQLETSAITQESDPTVADWAKSPTKPTYTAEEVGALPDDTPVSGNIENSTTSTNPNKALSAVQGFVIRREMERLLAALANSAFATSKPTFDWTTPGVVQTYSITRTLSNCSSSNTDDTITEGSTFTTTLSASSGYTLDGVTPTITMGGIAVSGAWNASTRTVTIENVSGDIVITAAASLLQQTFTIGYTLQHCTKSQDSATSVAEGGSFNATLMPDEGYTLNGVVATGSGFTQSYDSVNDRIYISGSNVSGNISIGCTASTYQVSVSYNLTGFSSETNTQITSGGSFTKVLTPNSGYVVRSITITMGGVDITSSVWTANTKTINIPLVTGNIVITATAEESVNHIVSLDLTGVSATSEIDLNDGVEDGGTLEVTLTKITSGEGSDVWPSSGLPTSRGFLARDVIVYMGDRVLEPKVGNELDSGVDLDLTVTQVDSNTVRVKIDGDGANANGVTGAVRIVNVIWKRQYIVTAESPQVVGGVPGQPYSDNSYSAHTNTFIPLPDGCKNLVVLGNNDTTPAQYVWGCAIYDEQKVFVSGHTMSPTADPVVVQVPPVDQSDQRNEGKYLRTSAWLTTSGVVSKIDDCYIFDATHGKFIWCGSNKVTSKDSIRSTYTQTQS